MRHASPTQSSARQTTSQLADAKSALMTTSTQWPDRPGLQITHNQSFMASAFFMTQAKVRLAWRAAVGGGEEWWEDWGSTCGLLHTSSVSTRGQVINCPLPKPHCGPTGLHLASVSGEKDQNVELLSRLRISRLQKWLWRETHVDLLCQGSSTRFSRGPMFPWENGRGGGGGGPGTEFQIICRLQIDRKKPKQITVD